MSMEDKYPPPFKKVQKARSVRVWILAAVVVVGVLALNHVYQWYPWPWAEPPEKIREAVVPPPPPPSAPPQVIDYAKIEEHSDQTLDMLIEARKKEFGLDQSVDMVVRPEEYIKLGDETVALVDILSEIERMGHGAGDSPETATPRGEVTEEDLNGSSAAPHLPRRDEIAKRPTQYYGVYVVRPGDNLWDIHFLVLMEYLKHRGIDVSPNADEAVQGRSTGVARILKYAESMVHVFNVKTRKLDQNLDILEPNSKVVVFNLTRLHQILGRIKPGQLDQVQYDGTDLYLPDDRPDTTPQPGAEAAPAAAAETGAGQPAP